MHKVWAISDWHLPHGVMDAYGEVWKDHDIRLMSNILKVVKKGDILLAPGDIINANNEESALHSIKFLADIPCRVIICPGNHDGWMYETSKKDKVSDLKFLPKNVTLLDGTCVKIGDLLVGGELFWCFKDAFPWEGHFSLPGKLGKNQNLAMSKFNKIIQEFSKDDAKHKVIMLHVPPISEFGTENAFTALIKASGASNCIYGHAHGVKDPLKATDTEIQGVRYQLISADYRNMMPIHVCDFNDEEK